MKVARKYLCWFLILPNITFAGNNNNNFQVSFTILPSCYIQTDRQNKQTIDIISQCSHEDFYITTSELARDKEYIAKTNVDNMSIVKNNDKTYTTINNITNQQTVITLNF